MITFKLNGKEVQGEEGQYILEVAKKYGVEIPTLCHHNVLESAGMCRLCTVELFDGRKTRFVTACNYPVWEGMEVYTDSEAVHEGRKLIVELLLARCPDVPVIKELAKKYGIETPRFKIGDSACILCGLCVRMCEERMGVSAISLAGRGADMRVETPFHIQTDVCQVCGACESVCPTGCIDILEIAKHEPRPLLSEWDVGLQERRAIYIPFPQAVPLAAAIDPDACVHVNTGNCGICRDVCEAGAIDFDQEEEIIEVKVGSIILATGYDLMDPTPMKQFGYGEYRNVFTSLEFERLSNATGPTGGKILIRDEEGEFTQTPKSVAILHCIGSRDINYHEYCSRVCCMYALKYSHLIKEKCGHDTAVYDFYIDQRCYGKGYEEFYKRCQEEGTTFVRGKVAEITDQAIEPEETGRLIAVAEDTLLGSTLRVPVDMVVLCSAIEARENAAEVGRIFGVNLGADGFFLEEHPKLGPLNTATDGVFLAGACQSPKDIPDTVAQASGAAVKALSLATRGVVQVPSTISYIDPDICSGCQVCIGLCPYSAIEFDEFRGISVINEAVCKGCGSCSGFCPSGAAQVRHFNKKQVFAEFEGIMNALHSVGM
ncbi:MAG: 4Fe-4S binding protein [Desulfobacteraceae bacterium]|jgi:heterodisulfide reductase subunit A